ncbi:pre-rRNA processing protein [Coemansia sp. RSA 1722]|nr:pre-rRNA processing protein [Coemansia sp. RSA 486]KAJ2237649.1 pre-rRNA processing protein [Coemansia sp. RSA 485]KAJ2596369.1 pre-rRNA processing protein [Coemansia sp. RSA 1721]KAJ2605668.1 pre-rRNA processing protein [Coemansia sp. RSA 1722]KAJ2639181.1 pre-rRNA processing protein [Coemansia sp. RSA 1286]
MARDRFLAQGVTTTKRQRSGKPVGGSAGGRKQAGGPGARPKKHTDDAGDESDDQIGDVDDLEHRHEPDEDEISSEDEFLETAAEKRLRLAKDYIGKIKESTELEADEYDAEQIDRDLVAERLMTDARERTGKWSRRIADHFSYIVDESEFMRVLKNGHRLPVTCVALTPDCKFVYSGSKDGSLIKWQRDTCRPLKVFPGQKKKNANYNRGHCDHILCVAVSSDGRYVATGGRDRRIHIWSVADDQHLAVFHQHKDSVTGLVFRRGTNHLYSCSADRMVKLWNIDELGYMDTLFGHQDSIVSIDALQRERAVTTGGRDKTVRLWKIADEAQLVFRAGSTTDQHRITKSLTDEKDTEVERRSKSAAESSKQHKDLLRKLAAADVELSETTVDVVAMVDEETYITGGDSGILSLWSIHKKKPVFNYHVAHGVHPLSASQKEDVDEEDDFSNAKNLVRPHWITALAAVPLTDLFFSASSDGFIRMWRMRSGKSHGFDLVNSIPVQGFVNGLSVRELAPNGDILATKKDVVLAAAIGQEHRLGRWEKVKARNVIKIFHLPVSGKNNS